MSPPRISRTKIGSSRAARLLVCLLMIASSLACSLSERDDEGLDLVLKGGRVIDPETGRDGIYDVGIEAGRVVAIREGDLSGDRVIDVSGLVVAPGFIDLHSHSPTPLGFRYQALDGVTTSLELEAGSFPVASVGGALEEGASLNFGASAGYVAMRLAVKLGASAADQAGESRGRALDGPGFREVADEEEREKLRALLHAGLDQGGLGIGLPLDYVSAAVDEAELRMIFSVAAEREAPLFVHIRRGLAGDPTGLLEVIDLAHATGAAVHVCHLQHSAMKGTGEFLRLIREARAEGLDVTTEMFPHNAGTTAISAAVFDRNWQEIFDIGYEDVEWAATGERFDRSTWGDYRQRHPEGMVIHHYVREEWTRAALREPGVIIVTDGVPAVKKSIRVPPQGIGTYARVLGRYVREEGVLDLRTAIAKMTWLPAKRLEVVAPVFRRKGRLQVGSDADITVFDPETIIDRSTYRDPFQASEGVRYLLVRGELVVRDGVFQEGVRPGEMLASVTP
ncbi:MAG: amidohydrolase family protein [Deltaproteobacteria bacterium]|jgi:N-acyl-D-aspartate/D-glutamate deacylase|nr:amidohydrolase family protein [Deltaproteobacteria bacterium]